MPQDAFHIRRSAAELDSLLRGGKINRVSQVDKDELTFIIYTGKSTVKLILSTNASNARVCLSAVEKEPAPVAPNFCMLLRKHLLGAEILSVSQYAFERIVEIRMRCVTDFSESERVLRCEIMGKYSNVILTENDVVLGALKTASLEENARRLVFAGAKYVYPEPQDKLSPFDGTGIDRRLKERFPDGETDPESLACFLFENVAGLALPTAREALRLQRERGDASSLGEYVGRFCAEEKCDPCFVTDDGTPTGAPKDFFAFPVKNGIPASTLNEAEDAFYTARETNRAYADKKRKLEAAVRALKKKRQKRLQEELERLNDCEQAEENRLKGELLTANLYRLEKGMKDCVLENWYDPENRGVKIALDPTLTPAQNAQRYFKTYAKQKRTKEALIPRVEAEREELAYADSVSAAIELSENAIDLRETETELIALGLVRPPEKRAGGKRKETTVPFREYLCDGFRIFGGRNNLQNDRLLKSCAPDDLWLHAQKYHSSHVVIATEGRQVSDKALLFAAEVCAYYSDGRDGGKVPVDYCRRKSVRKPPKSPAGFVTYTEYKTLLVEPVRHDETVGEKNAGEH